MQWSYRKPTDIGPNDYRINENTGLVGVRLKKNRHVLIAKSTDITQNDKQFSIVLLQRLMYSTFGIFYNKIKNPNQ